MFIVCWTPNQLSIFLHWKVFEPCSCPSIDHFVKFETNILPTERDDPARTEDMAHLLTAALAFSNRNQFVQITPLTRNYLLNLILKLHKSIVVRVSQQFFSYPTTNTAQVSVLKLIDFINLIKTSET